MAVSYEAGYHIQRDAQPNFGGCPALKFAGRCLGSCHSEDRFRTRRDITVINPSIRRSDQDALHSCYVVVCVPTHRTFEGNEVFRRDPILGSHLRAQWAHHRAMDGRTVSVQESAPQK